MSALFNKINHSIAKIENTAKSTAIVSTLSILIRVNNNVTTTAELMLMKLSIAEALLLSCALAKVNDDALANTNDKPIYTIAVGINKLSGCSGK